MRQAFWKPQGGKKRLKMVGGQRQGGGQQGPALDGSSQIEASLARSRERGADAGMTRAVAGCVRHVGNPTAEERTKNGWRQKAGGGSEELALGGRSQIEVSLA